MQRNFFSPALSIDAEPPGQDTATSGSGGPSLEQLQAQLQQSQAKAEGQEALIAKLRLFERQYKSLEAIVGETNPEKLQELREAATQLEQQKAKAEQAVMQARTEVTQEYKGKLETVTDQLTTAQKEAQAVQTKFALFQAFNGNGGIGSRFEAFVNLAATNFERLPSGELQVRDDAGTLITATDEQGVAKPVTPSTFVKLLASGGLDNYQLNQREMLQLTLEAYNKSSGAGLPGSNGAPGGSSLQSMSQAELAKYAFQ